MKNFKKAAIVGSSLGIIASYFLQKIIFKMISKKTTKPPISKKALSNLIFSIKTKCDQMKIDLQRQLNNQSLSLKSKIDLYKELQE